MSDQQRQRWALVAATAAGVALPVAAATYYWRVRCRMPVDGTDQAAPAAARGQKEGHCLDDCQHAESRHAQLQQPGKMPEAVTAAAASHLLHSQSQNDSSSMAAAIQDGPACSWGSPAGQAPQLGPQQRLAATSHDGGPLQSGDSDCFETAVVQALLDVERARWRRSQEQARADTKPDGPELSPRGVLSGAGSSRRSDSLKTSGSCDDALGARGAFSSTGFDGLSDATEIVSGRFVSLSSDAAGVAPAADRPPWTVSAPASTSTPQRETFSGPAAWQSAPAAAAAAVLPAALAPNAGAEAEARIPTLLRPAAVRVSRSFGSEGADWEEAQTLVQYMARDEFWTDAAACDGDESLRRTSQAALRGVSWMADAEAGPTDTAAAREFLRGLPEQQRRAIVTRAHAVLRAVLERAAGSPTASPRMSPAASPTVSPKGALLSAHQPQVRHGVSASAPPELQQALQQPLQHMPAAAPGLPAQSLPEPCWRSASPSIPAAGSASDLYSAFAEAVGGDPHGTSPAVSRCSSGRTAAAPAECSAAVVSKAAAAAAGSTKADAAEAILPGHSVLVAEPGCTACQAATGSMLESSGICDAGSDPTSVSTVTRSPCSSGSGSNSDAMQPAAPLQAAANAPPASPFAVTAAAAARQADEPPPPLPAGRPLLNKALAAARQVAIDRQDSHTLPWQQAMRAQQTFVARKAAAEAARGAASGASPPQQQPLNAPGNSMLTAASGRRAWDPAAFGSGMAVTEEALAATVGEDSSDEAVGVADEGAEAAAITARRSRQREVQRQSLDMALAALPLQSMTLCFDDIKICRRPNGELWKLGSGGFGTVYKALKNDVQPVAAKLLAADGDQDAFLREVSILESCRDRNIVQFLGAVSDGEQIMLITEFMELGDLFTALQRDTTGSLLWYRRHGNQVPGLGRRIALDVARGLHFLHTSRIVHMDVKTANVLLGRNYIAKISDVGMAQIQRKVGGRLTGAQNPISTFAWAAPEVLMGEQCTEKVDIYSLGVVLWELCSGEVPQRGRMRPLRVPQEAPQAVADVIAACLSLVPTQRPSAKDIVEALVAADQPPAKAAPGMQGAGPKPSRRRESAPLSAAALAAVKSSRPQLPPPTQRSMDSDVSAALIDMPSDCPQGSSMGCIVSRPPLSMFQGNLYQAAG